MDAELFLTSGPVWHTLGLGVRKQPGPWHTKTTHSLTHAELFTSGCQTARVYVTTAVRQQAMADAETKGFPLQSNATPEAQGVLHFLFLYTTSGAANKRGSRGRQGRRERFAEKKQTNTQIKVPLCKLTSHLLKKNPLSAATAVPHCVSGNIQSGAAGTSLSPFVFSIHNNAITNIHNS